MATNSAAFSVIKVVTTANTTDTVTLTDNTSNIVEVYNSGTVDLYFTVSGADPTITGTPVKDVYWVPAGLSRSVFSPNTPDVVSIKSSGVTTYSVTGQASGS